MFDKDLAKKKIKQIENEIFNAKFIAMDAINCDKLKTRECFERIDECLERALIDFTILENILGMISKDRIELKNCPCCDGEAYFGSDVRHQYRVICSNCGVTTKWYHSAEEAANAWNKRVKEQE